MTIHKIKHVTISSIIQHTGQGYGFKLTFLGLDDANVMKPQIISFLHKQGWIVTNRKESYYESSE